MKRKNIINGISLLLLSTCLVLGGCSSAAGEDSGMAQETGNVVISSDKEGTEAGNSDAEGSNAESSSAGASGAGTSGAGTSGADGSEENKKEESSADYAAYFKNMTLAKSYKLPNSLNPIMTQRFGADPFAMTYEDRVYFFMTADAKEYNAEGEMIENTYSKINTISLVSTDDMVNFTDHGEIKVAGKDGAAKWARNSWAPAAAWKMIDGKPKFFLYFADSGNGIGVVCADSPEGPYTDPIGGPIISRSMPNCGNVTWLFDPAVLVDDDGRGYLYFGGGIPSPDKISDPGTARVIELGDDMISVKGEAQRIDVPYLFEDSGIHKYGNKYYYTYCSNWQVDEEGSAKYGFKSAEIVSMESDSPMGPFTLKERILENPGVYFGLYGNNHHCVFTFKDKWYITYHARALEKSMGLAFNYRSTHIEEFQMGEDGTIGKIKQTLTGGRSQLKYVDPYQEVSAVNISMAAGIVTAETVQNGKNYMVISDVEEGSYVMVTGVDFGDKAPQAMEIWVKADAVTDDMVIKASLDKVNGTTIAYLPVKDASGEATENGFKRVSVSLEGEVTGVHDLFFVFGGNGYDVKSWSFFNEFSSGKKEAVGELSETDCPDEITKTVDGVSYGKIEHFTYFSKTTNCDRGANILLPEDYSADKKYPVVYFLHGIFGDEYSLIGDANNKLQQILGNLVANGSARDMIVVFPHLYASDDPDLKPGFSADVIWPYDNFINDLVNDLIPYMEANYSVSDKKEDRGVLGFSMGGRESLFIGVKRPDLFNCIGAISPAPGLTPAKDWAMTHVGQMAEEELKITDADNLPKLLMVCCGTKDSVVGKFPASYHDIMTKNGVEHMWYEIDGADHDNRAIRSGFYNFLIRF